MPTDHQLQWRRACGNGACVEVATTPSIAYVRDSKAPHEARLAVSGSAWSAFVTAVTDGDLSASRI